MLVGVSECGSGNASVGRGVVEGIGHRVVMFTPERTAASSSLKGADRQTSN